MKACLVICIDDGKKRKIYPIKNGSTYMLNNFNITNNKIIYIFHLTPKAECLMRSVIERIRIVKELTYSVLITPEQ